MTDTEAFSNAFQIFTERIYPSGDSLMCQLHECFESSYEGNRHNCLGCNFAEATGWVNNQLERMITEESYDMVEAITFYLLSLYLVVERIYVIFDIIKLAEEIRWKRFRVLQDIHKWANFIKHPKAFMLVHHPVFRFEGQLGIIDFSHEGRVIDQGFVNEYYSGGDKNKPLFDTLQNSRDVVVVFPDPVELTERFCAAVEAFVDLIKNNETHREMLGHRSSFENYYLEEDREAAEGC